MTSQEKNRRAVQAVLEEMDVDMAGVARIVDIEGTPLAESALELLPSCRSIVVMGMEIYTEFLDLAVAERVMGAPRMNDLLERHKNYLRGRLVRAAYDLARTARARRFKALPLSGEGPSVDSRFPKAVFSFKEAAEAAGLGEIGMSGLLITKQFGPRVLLNVCLTEAELDSTAAEDKTACRYCNICVFKCPAHAVGYPERDKGEKCRINAFACAQYVETAGGCSECMRVCPVASPRYE